MTLEKYVLLCIDIYDMHILICRFINNFFVSKNKNKNILSADMNQNKVFSK